MKMKLEFTGISWFFNSSRVSQCNIDANWFFELHTLQCRPTLIEYIHQIGGLRGTPKGKYGVPKNLPIFIK